MEKQREKFSSRLGFLLISAGCAIGLGNVWRFPYITGKYGGAAFVLLYLVFLIFMGLPIMVMELAVGRASQRSIAKSFDVLEKKGAKFHWYKYPSIAGNYLLMMFYTSVAGWMLIYCKKLLSGDFVGASTAEIDASFTAMISDPIGMVIAVAIIVVGCFAVCALGFQNGVEKITKFMMLCLFAIMLVLVGNSLLTDGAAEGLRFYLYPDFNKLMDAGLSHAIFDAMGQAFFTLSVGMGSIAIFGSYIDRKHRLSGEALRITILDTSVAFMAGLIIFPACFTYGVDPQSGPDLIFKALPSVFSVMPGGRVWGTLFFIFLLFAALSTVIAVFENIVSFWIDLKDWSRKKAVIINGIALMILSLPCIFGFNIWGFIKPFGEGSTIMDLEDFIISNNILPLGALIYLLFCTYRFGWGWDKFIEEANTGMGAKFPKKIRFYVAYILPVIVLYIFIQGYIAKFFS